MSPIVLQIGEVSAVEVRVLLWLACGNRVHYSVGARGQSSAALVGNDPITNLSFKEDVDVKVLVQMRQNGWLNHHGTFYELTKLGEFIVFNLLSGNKVGV